MPEVFISPVSPAGKASFLKGGGEMGQRIRGFDWASTPVGPIDSWPQSLLTAVNTALGSRFPMFIWWGKDLIQFYNDAYRPSLGNNGKHPSALGQRGEECWPEIWPVIYPLIRQVLDGGDATWSEDQLIPIYRNGRLEDVYWTFSYSPLVDERGAVGGVLVVCSENTEKVHNFQRLKESEDQLSFAIEAAELGTWDLNPANGKFTSNSRLKNWFGLGPMDEVELSVAIEAMIETDRPRVAEAIQRALRYESGGFYEIQYTIVNRKTGVERIVRAKGRAWFSEEKIAYRFNGTLQDITEQERARIRLEQEQEKARLAIESANLGTFYIDLRREEIVTSERFNSIWGVPEEEGMTLQKLSELIHPEDQVIRDQANQQAIETGTINYECRIIWPDASPHWVRMLGAVIYDDQGKPASLIGVTQDISRQKEFEGELTRQVAERTVALQRSNNDLLQFAHVISHDLKEPVRKVKIFSNRIVEEMNEVLPEKGHAYLRKIQHATDRMLSMIEGVLQYSSLSSMDEPAAPVDLNELLKNIESDLEVVFQQKSAHLSYSTLPVVEGVPILIYQLFYNLVNNSLKFSRGGVDPVIMISCRPAPGKESEFVEISLEDNGIGFDQSHAAGIFESFTRLHSKDRFEGTGLGLSLSKKIVERHGGTIMASGVLGRGSTFTFSLPAAE